MTLASAGGVCATVADDLCADPDRGPHCGSRTLDLPANRVLLLTSSPQRYQSLLDASTPHLTARWVFAVALLVFFMFRVVYYEVSRADNRISYWISTAIFLCVRCDLIVIHLPPGMVHYRLRARHLFLKPAHRFLIAEIGSSFEFR